MITFKCSSCAYEMKVSDKSAGRTSTCKRCREPFRVPNAANSAVNQSKRKRKKRKSLPSAPVQLLFEKFNISPEGWETLKPCLLVGALCLSFWGMNEFMWEISSFWLAMSIYAGSLILQLGILFAMRESVPRAVLYSTAALSGCILLWTAYTDNFAVQDDSVPNVTKVSLYSRWNSVPESVMEIHVNEKGPDDYFMGYVNQDLQKHGEWHKWNN